MNLGEKVYVYRDKAPAESHMVKPFVPAQAELAWVVYVNLDGSVNVAGYSADGGAFAIANLKKDSKVKPYFVTTAPAASQSKPVVTGKPAKLELKTADVAKTA